jgi:putative DNA primase/helicase
MTAERTKENGRATMLPGPSGLTLACPSRNSHFSRSPAKGVGIVAEVAVFLRCHIVLPPVLILVITAWVLAAWLSDAWDRFPHLAITSPDRRCGKTRLLDLLKLITPNAYCTSNISCAALYRLIELKRPTLLLDEAQSIRRRASEVSEVLRELLNAGIDRDAKVLRVGGESNSEIQEFGIYAPKVIALIGELDGVLADRCLPIDMRRKTVADTIQPYRSRIVEPIGKALHAKLEHWAKKYAKRVAAIYDHLEAFAIRNDRMAELLLPLQAVLKVADPASLKLLESYAHSLDERDRDTVSPGVQLLAACREIVGRNKIAVATGFISTQSLLTALMQRDWEPWCHWSQGRAMTPHALGDLLRPFSIRASRNRNQTARGFIVRDFEEAWVRYLPPRPSPEAAKTAKPN